MTMLKVEVINKDNNSTTKFYTYSIGSDPNGNAIFRNESTRKILKIPFNRILNIKAL